MRLLLTCRTPTHLAVAGRLQEAIGAVAPIEVAVDRLRTNELSALDKIFEQSGLLGNIAKIRADERVKKITVDCNGQFQDILLWLFDAPHIKQRLNDIFEDLAQKPNAQEVVVGALVLRHIGASSDLSLLAELTGVEFINQALFGRYTGITEFLNLERDNIIARSSLFSTMALRTFWSTGKVAKLMAEMLSRALELRFDGSIYRDIARDLMRFSTIKALLPNEQQENRLVDYYERIKNFEGCSRNPFFWLQYAIARLDMKRFDIAQRYLDTAYSLASRIEKFETYQLDNTQARLLLQRCIDEERSMNAFADFVRANRIINAQVRERRHAYYPFRVASYYGAFWKRVAHAWPEEQRNVFLAACRAISQFIATIDRNLVSHPDVTKCRNAIDQVLKE